MGVPTIVMVVGLPTMVYWIVVGVPIMEGVLTVLSVLVVCWVVTGC